MLTQCIGQGLQKKSREGEAGIKKNEKQTGVQKSWIAQE